MKYTRLDLQSSISKNAIKNVFIFFIIIPIISITAGKIFTSFFILPYVKKNVQPAQYAVNLETKKYEKVNYYFLQAGVFTNKANAEILQKGIKNAGESSYVLNNSDSFRVIVDYSSSKKDIENKQEKLRKSGYDCIISDTSFETKNTKDTCSQYINSIIGLIASEQKYIEDFEKKKDMSSDDIKNQQSQVKQMFEKVKADKELEVYIKQVKSFNEDALKISDIFIKEMNNNKIDAQKSYFVDEIYKFNDIYEKLNNIIIK